MEGHGAAEGVTGPQGGEREGRGAGGARDEGEPAQQRLHGLAVAVDAEMRDAVGRHDGGAAELLVGGVDAAAHELVERLVAGENDGRVVSLLQRALTKSHEIGADADGAAGNHRQREDLLIGSARLSGDEAAAGEVFHAQIALRADHRSETVDERIVELNGIGDHAVAESAIVGLGEVEEVHAAGGIVLPQPLHAEAPLHLLCESDARAAVGGEEDAGNALLSRPLGDQLEESVLTRAEGAGAQRDVVAEEQNLAAGGLVGREERQLPGDHRQLVEARRPHHLAQTVTSGTSTQRELRGMQKGCGGCAGGTVSLAEEVAPAAGERVAEEVEEVVAVERAAAAGGGALALERLLRGVGRGDGFAVPLGGGLVSGLINGLIGLVVILINRLVVR